MALKFLLDSLEGLSESIAALYEKNGDKFQLKVDGMVSKSSLDEFRNNNVTLLREKANLDAKLKTFGEHTPEQIAAMTARLQEIEDQKLLDAEEFDKLFDKRTERLRTEYDGQITALTASKETTDAENIQIL